MNFEQRTLEHNRELTEALETMADDYCVTTADPERYSYQKISKQIAELYAPKKNKKRMACIIQTGGGKTRTMIDAIDCSNG